MYRQTPPPQPYCNPTDAERHALLQYILLQAGRPEDFDNVIRLLSPPPDISNYAAPGSMKDLRIGIIGGGCAGISAAFELRKTGADITIFDAEERVGGRIYTYYFDQSKKNFGELGAMRIPVSHETTWHYINLFNLDTRVFTQSNPNTFIYVQGKRIRNHPELIQKELYPLYDMTPLEKNTPWPQLYSYATETALRSLPPAVRTEILKVLPYYNPQLTYLSNLNTRQVFEGLGLSQGAIDLITSIDPITGALLYYSHDESLADAYPGGFNYLYRIQGGTVNLPLAFYNSLISPTPDEYAGIPADALGRVDWRSGRLVSGIYRDDMSGKVILRFNSSQEPQYTTEAFDYVICAIPFSMLRAVDIAPRFSNLKMEAIREINYANAQKTICYCNRKFWQAQTPSEAIIGGVSHTDLMIESIVYPSMDYPCLPAQGTQSGELLQTALTPDEPGVFIATYNFNLDATRLGNMTPETRFELIKRQVEEVHGLPKNYLDSVIIDHKTIVWNNEPHFHGAFAYLLPGQKITFSYSVLQPEYGGKVFFAGEHISPTHGWIQGALYTGKLAANALAQTAQSNSAYT